MWSGRVGGLSVGWCSGAAGDEAVAAFGRLLRLLQFSCPSLLQGLSQTSATVGCCEVVQRLRGSTAAPQRNEQRTEAGEAICISPVHRGRLSPVITAAR